MERRVKWVFLRDGSRLGQGASRGGQPSPLLSNFLAQPLFREANGGALVSTGKAGGLPRLRRPSGLGEVWKSAAFSSVGGVGPSSSRVRFPVALTSRQRRRRCRDGIRSSRTPPRLDDALLRRRRRVCGGRLFRSLGGLRQRRCQGCFDCCGCNGWLESGSSLCSCEACRQRALIQGRRCSGRVPGRCSFIVIFILASASGGCCGSSKSFIAMGLLQIWGSQDFFFFVAGDRRGIGGGRRRKLLAKLGFTGSKGLFVISDFVRDLCVIQVEQLSLYPPRTYPCLYSYLYVP
jgi:hypothetical protein